MEGDVTWPSTWNGEKRSVCNKEECNHCGECAQPEYEQNLHLSDTANSTGRQAVVGADLHGATTVHCHLFLIRVTGGQSPAVRRGGAVLQSIVHLVFRALFPRHVLGLKNVLLLFQVIVPWLFSLISFHEPMVHQHNNTTNSLEVRVRTKRMGLILIYLSQVLRGWKYIMSSIIRKDASFSFITYILNT